MNYYSDESLFNAGPAPKFRIKTIAEIQAHFPELPVMDVWRNPSLGFLKIASYEEAVQYANNGRITEEQFSAFQAIWRNLTPRLSSTAIQYEF